LQGSGGGAGTNASECGKNQKVCGKRPGAAPDQLELKTFRAFDLEAFLPRNFPIMSVHSGVLAAARRFQSQTREEVQRLLGYVANCSTAPSAPSQPSHAACANQPQSHPPTMTSVTADGAGALVVPASCKRKAEANRPGSPAHDAKIAAKGSRKRGCPRVPPTPRCGKCAPCIAGPRPTGSYKNKCKVSLVHACTRQAPGCVLARGHGVQQLRTAASRVHMMLAWHACTRQAPGCVRAHGHRCGSCAWPHHTCKPRLRRPAGRRCFAQR
jgi:hypothetical protein